MEGLTIKEIEQFASLKGAKRIAVENFLGTLENNETKTDAMINLRADANSYHWNEPTYNAIRKGIHYACRNGIPA